MCVSDFPRNFHECKLKPGGRFVQVKVYFWSFVLYCKVCLNIHTVAPRATKLPMTFLGTLTWGTFVYVNNAWHSSFVLVIGMTTFSSLLPWSEDELTKLSHVSHDFTNVTWPHTKVTWPHNCHMTSYKCHMSSDNYHMTSHNYHMISYKCHMTSHNCHMTSQMSHDLIQMSHDLSQVSHDHPWSEEGYLGEKENSVATYKKALHGF